MAKKTPSKAEIIAQRRIYEAAEPKQFGTMHERLKYLKAVARKAELWKTHNDVWQAIFDLQMEVSAVPSPVPPIGRRTVRETGNPPLD